MKIDFDRTKISGISKRLLNLILKSKNSGAKVIALSGDLGSGKTTLTQEIGKHLNIKENIISPTFVIMKIYTIDKKSEYYSHFKKLIHIDAYRLNSHLELLKIGWETLVADKNNLIILEWPQMVNDCLNKKDTIWVYLKHKDDQTRTIEF